MRVRALALLGVGAALAVVPATASAQLPSTTDPRASLAQGLENPGVAAKGMELLAHVNKPPGWFDPANPGDVRVRATPTSPSRATTPSSAASTASTIWNISNPSAPTITDLAWCARAARVTCRSTGTCCSCRSSRRAAKKDCDGSTPAATRRRRFCGVRIFDISNIDAPVQVGQVQTCRGSHTHTLVRPKNDADNVYIYVSGTAGPRNEASLAGCDGNNTNDADGRRTRRSGGSRSSRSRSPLRRRRRS